MRKLMTAAAFALLMSGGAAIAQETLKIGYIDPLSGGGASIGEVGLKTFQFLADEVNAKGGIQGKKVEIVPLDNKTDPAIKSVYLINQDYSFGEAVRSQAKAMLGAKRPDIKIVGDELHPLLKITDFAPYIAKIKASGADTVVTGNWGQDFALLLKAAADAGLKVNWYTYYAGGTGGPTAVKQANLNHQVFQVGEGIPNLDNPPSQEFEKAFRAKYDVSVFYPRAVNQMRMLAAAADKAKSADPIKVAQALEGMDFEVLDGGKGYMRKDDHQFFQPIYISSLGERTEREPFEEEKTGWGWKLVAKIDTPATVLPPTCKMERPN